VGGLLDHDLLESGLYSLINLGAAVGVIWPIRLLLSSRLPPVHGITQLKVSSKK